MNIQELLDTGKMQINGSTFTLRDRNGRKEIVATSNDLSLVKMVCDEYRKHNANFDILLSVGRYKNRYDLDYTIMEEYQSSLGVHYSEDYDAKANYLEFISYQTKLNVVRNIIRNGNFSPLEKFIIAYDFAKSFPYKLSEDESLNGLPHHTINGEYIDCRGYCFLIREILCDEEGINFETIGLTVFDKQGNHIDGHAIGGVVLDDDKYGIHGLFFTNPTGDSYKESYKKVFGEDYQPQDLYQDILKPVLSSEMYSDENYEYRIDCLMKDEELFKKSVSELSTLGSFNQTPEELLYALLHQSEYMEFMEESGFEKLVGDMSPEEIASYVRNGNFTTKQLQEALLRVKVGMGYTVSEAITEVDRVLRIDGFIQENFKGNQKN